VVTRTPDFKTIAGFRKDNGKGIKNACRQFVELCRQMNMFTDAVVAIDGSKFKAVNADWNKVHDDAPAPLVDIERVIDTSEHMLTQVTHEARFGHLLSCHWVWMMTSCGYYPWMAEYYYFGCSILSVGPVTPLPIILALSKLSAQAKHPHRFATAPSFALLLQ
jgi:hypothetical protein